MNIKRLSLQAMLLTSQLLRACLKMHLCEILTLHKKIYTTHSIVQQPIQYKNDIQITSTYRLKDLLASMSVYYLGQCVFPGLINYQCKSVTLIFSHSVQICVSFLWMFQNAVRCNLCLCVKETTKLHQLEQAPGQVSEFCINRFNIQENQIMQAGQKQADTK